MVRRFYVHDYHCLENFDLPIGRLSSALLIGAGVRPTFQYVQRLLVLRFKMPDQRGESSLSTERFNPADLAAFIQFPTEHGIGPIETDLLSRAASTA